MKTDDTSPLITIALPKGRLLDEIRNLFVSNDLGFTFERRKLIAFDNTRRIKFFLVKNADLPTYVNHGIAGLGICGSDVIYESAYQFNKLHTFPFGGTRMCLASIKGRGKADYENQLSVATKYTRFTRNYFYKKGVPVNIIKLNGSVELAPVMGLTQYIVDLVETGSTLKANNLEILNTLEEIKVHLIANPAYYKLHYKEINWLVNRIRE